MKGCCKYFFFLSSYANVSNLFYMTQSNVLFYIPFRIWVRNNFWNFIIRKTFIKNEYFRLIFQYIVVLSRKNTWSWKSITFQSNIFIYYFWFLFFVRNRFTDYAVCASIGVKYFVYNSSTTALSVQHLVWESRPLNLFLKSFTNVQWGFISFGIFFKCFQNSCSYLELSYWSFL